MYQIEILLTFEVLMVGFVKLQKDAITETDVFDWQFIIDCINYSILIE